MNEEQISRVELARRLFKEYYSRCFWHWNPDFDITEATIPLIVKGLCTNGGHKGMSEAAKLQKTEKG